uniref:non-specific serine/threonine protein kinase n=1 Tax=Stegastes partitus TaxID=144197 RepID=A0A3B5B0Q1_9TELE
CISLGFLSHFIAHFSHFIDHIRLTEHKYEQQHKLGAGGCGSVFAGCRKSDNLPVFVSQVAIKRVPTDKILCKHVVSVQPAGTISLLDWYDLGQELILVLERPVPCEDLFDYVAGNGGSLEEEEAKVGCWEDPVSKV